MKTPNLQKLQDFAADISLRRWRLCGKPCGSRRDRTARGGETSTGSMPRMNGSMQSPRPPAAGMSAHVSYAQRIFDGSARTIAQALGSAAE
jgi:hypothetical protein